MRAEGFSYRKGFRNPRGAWPAEMSLSLTSEMTLAKVGLAQLVPSRSSSLPFFTTLKAIPAAETSGYPRPVVLNLPLLVLPRVFR